MATALLSAVRGTTLSSRSFGLSLFQGFASLTLLFVLAASIPLGRVVSADQKVPSSLSVVAGNAPQRALTTSASSFSAWMRSAHEFARKQGFAAGFPDFKCESKRDGSWDRHTCGIVLLNSTVAEERWVSETELGVRPTLTAAGPGEMFTLASDYAARVGGFVGAYPTMKFVDGPGAALNSPAIRFWQLILLREAGGADWRDVARRELGAAPADAWDVRTRQANAWATARGFVGALQNFHEADYGSGVVYGTHLFGAVGAFHATVPAIVFGVSDTAVIEPATGVLPVSLIGKGIGGTATFNGGSSHPRDATCGKTRITSVTNTSDYAIRAQFVDCAGTLRVETMNAYASTSAFNGMDLTGEWTARLAETVILPEHEKIVDLPIGVSINWSSTIGNAPKGTATPYPPSPAEPWEVLYYRIVPPGNQASLTTPKPAQVVEVQFGSCGNNASLIQNTPSDDDGQLFRFIKNSDGTFLIRSKLSGLDWDVEGGSRLQQFTQHGFPNQRFRLVKRRGNEFLFEIRPLSDLNKVLGVTGASLDRGAGLSLISPDPKLSSTQTFRLEPSFSLGAQPGAACLPAPPPPVVQQPAFPNWQQVDGSPATATIVVDAKTGTLVQLHRDGSIYRFGGSPYRWEPIDQNPAAIAVVAAGGAIYELHNTGSVFEFTGKPFSWRHIDSSPDTVAITADASTGALFQMHRDGSIYVYSRTPFRWLALDANPATVAIVAGGGALYQRHNSGSVFKFAGKPFSWQHIDASPDMATIVTDGVTGTLYGLHRDGSIYAYSGTPFRWQTLDRNPATVAIIASGGTLFQLHRSGSAWRYVGVPLTGWRQIDDNPQTAQLASGGGHLFQRHLSGAIWRHTGS